MPTDKTLSITLPLAVITQTQKAAKRENRTQSELIRDALRRYFLDQEWSEINADGKAKAKQLGIKATDVNRIIKEYRTDEKTKQTKRKN
jgi:metal-responsive CopG/Arc/MetJ family transcriptional regulator